MIKEYTENKDAEVIKTKNGRLQLKSQGSICGNKKPRFVSKNEGPGILSTLRIKTPLSKLPSLNILF